MAPCLKQLDADCFRSHPGWAKQALAYRLVHLLTPKPLTKRLPKGLRLALIAPGVDLPPGLELPPGVVQSGATVPQQAMDVCLQRFDTIVKQPEYLSLSQRPEFVTTHQLLREFATLNSAAQSQALTLPPPPVNSTPNPGSRY